MKIRKLKFKSGPLSLILLHLVILAVVVTNFPNGNEWFLGWDALSPELNFPLNFHRAIFGAWQENYGVGTMGGHGFAATLPHTLITFLLSLFLPIHAIRPAFTLLCFYLGALGLYFLIKLILQKLAKHGSLPLVNRNPQVIDYTALLAALFYIFNLGTTQMFYLQLEAFIIHFAALPWLYLATLRLFQNKSGKNVFFFIIVNFLASAQSFIPSLFVAFISSLLLFLFMYLVSHKFVKHAVVTALLVIGLTFIVNAYWLLPWGYYVLTDSNQFMSAYNNIVSTPRFVGQSQKYGDLGSVAVLKGLYWETFELGEYVFKPWRNHHQLIITQLIGYSFFAFTLLGLLGGLIRFKNWLVRSLSLVLLYFFANLATSSVPFSFIHNLLQTVSPTYFQAFRTTFTKFSLGAAFAYSVFFALGILFFIELLRRFIRKEKLVLMIFPIFFGSLIFYALPLLQGNLIYKKLFTEIPQSYFDVIDYFRNQPDGRIADFPQDCAEGWYGYRWGYFGSGFYWYGIRQSFMSRTFDVWNPHNENYYWEVTQALRGQDFNRLDKILEKYDVRWVLYDPNFINCRNQKSFLVSSEFVNYLNTSPEYRLVRQVESPNIQNLTLYERTNFRNAENSYIDIVSAIPNIGPIYQWNDDDRVLLTLLPYQTNSQSKYDTYYPFRSLLTKRTPKEKELEVQLVGDEMNFTHQLSSSLTGFNFKIESLSSLETVIPISIRVTQDADHQHNVSLELLTPRVYIDNKELFNLSEPIPLGSFTSNSDSFMVLVNGSTIEKNENNDYISSFYLRSGNRVKVLTQESNVLLEWTDSSSQTYQEKINQDTIIPVPQYNSGVFKVSLPRINDNEIFGVAKFSAINRYLPQACGVGELYSTKNTFQISEMPNDEHVRLISQDSQQCLMVPIETIRTDLGYLLEVRTKHISGNNLRLVVKNKNRSVGLDIYLPTNNSVKTDRFILPPNFKNEQGYELYFENTSFNNSLAVNDFAGVSAWQIPYNFLKQIRFIDSNNQQTKYVKDASLDFTVTHLTPTEYLVSSKSPFNENRSLPKTLILYQSFHPGWLAYRIKNNSGVRGTLEKIFPYIFAEKLTNHVLVNNWANGWTFEPTTNNQQLTTIYILFWPQLLEFVGFALLPLPFLFIVRGNKRLN